MTLGLNKKWKEKESLDCSSVDEIANEMKVSSLFAQLCVQRGLSNKEQIESFLQPDENWFHDPFLMFDMQKARDRIMRAIENEEKISIYGDYDADGVTGTALMVETLEMIGANIDYYIPNRFKEGYGPNKNAFKHLVEEGTKVILTVDNGVMGHQAIHYAQEKNVDVIVSDHHELPEKLPDAYAVIHPKHPESHYPFGDLAGVGVALKLASALLGELPVEYLDLAAIGTVADLVFLTDENRAIVKYGLKMLKKTQRLGLLSLLKICDVEPDDLDENAIGFRIGPRLNAVGRLGEASLAVDLLTTFDDIRAAELAAFVEKKNEERKEIVNSIVEEALEQLSTLENSSVYVLAKEGWHEGVLGIVASRIVNETGKPAIVLNINSQTGEAKGSGRSIQAFNLYEACNESKHLFNHFGGHHMAAGMSLPIDNIKTLHQSLNEKAEIIQRTTEFTDELNVDLECGVSEISLQTINEIEALKPFGQGNPRPAFKLKNVQPFDARRIGVDKSHLKFKVHKEQNDLDVIAFRFGEIADALKGNPTISLLGTAEINSWNGRQKPQFVLSDLKVEGTLLFDKRSNNVSKDLFKIESVYYIFFNEHLHNKLSMEIPVSSQALLFKTPEDIEALTKKEAIIYVDCPPSITFFKNVFYENKSLPTYCSFYTEKEYYLKGMPSRNDFSKLYKFLAAHQNISLKKKGVQLAEHLNLDPNILKFMIKVFLEAGFVTMDNGILNSIENPKKIELSKTKVYKQHYERIKAEQLFVFSSFKDLSSTLRKWALEMKESDELKEQL